MEEINPQSNALRWLLEMEIISDPNVLNSFVLNTFRLSDSIQDVEFVTDPIGKKLLVYVKLSWWGKRFRKQQIQDGVENMFRDAIPSYTVRIVFDREILEKAIKMVSK